MSYSTIRRGRMAADFIGQSFTQVYNGLIRDARLNGTAKAAFFIIASHRDGYGISVASLSTHMKEQRDAIKKALNELERYGYLVRTQTRGPGGRLGESIYEITDMPEGLTLLADPPYPGPDKPRSAPKVENPPPAPTSENAGEPGTHGQTVNAQVSTEDGFSVNGETVDGQTVDGESATKKTNPQKTTKQKRVPSSLRDEGTREDARTRDEADQAQPTLPGLPGPSNTHDQNRTVEQKIAEEWWRGLKVRPATSDARETVAELCGRMLEVGWPQTKVLRVLRLRCKSVRSVPSAKTLTLWLLADKVAAEWWESLERKPMGKGAWESLVNACLAALERDWTEDQVKYVLKHRALSVPSVQRLETWLREAADEAKAQRARRAAGRSAGSGAGAGRGPWVDPRMPEAERQRNRNIWVGKPGNGGQTSERRSEGPGEDVWAGRAS